MSINVHLCLSTCLSICLCVFYASMFLCMDLSIYLYIYLPTNLPTYLSIYNSIYKSIYVSIYLSTSTLPAKLFIWLLEKKLWDTVAEKKKEHKPFSCQGKKQRRTTDAAYINVCLSIYLFI